jgi:hypothetical protein
MPPEGLDEARDAFAQEIPQATRQRDQSGRFVSTNKPEPIFQPRDVEGDDRGDTSDGGADPRFLEQERRVADGRSEEGDAVQKPAKRASAAANDNDEPAEDQPPERIGQDADDADPDGEKPDKGAGPEQEPGEDTSPRYKIQVDGEEREVSLNEALRGYQREETFNTRMRQMVEVAKTIDQRGAEAQQAREAYIDLCKRQEEEFAALIPKEPDWEQLYKQDPAAAHNLEKNYKAVYGTLDAIRQRRTAAQQQAYNDNAQRTASYARAEFDKFVHRNKLANQTEVDRAINSMRRTASNHGFSEDEISSTYDERMLSILHKAAKYDNMVANKPFPVQPERQGALQPGSAPRIGNGAARSLNDAQKRLAATGRVDDAALVMAQFLRPQR